MKLQQLLTPVLFISARKLKPWLVDQFGVGFLQALFLSVCLGVSVLLFVIYQKIQAANDATPITVKKKLPGQPEVSETVTTKDYDLSELKKLFTKNLMSLGIGLFLHYKFNMDEPLLLQSLMLPLQTLSAPLVKIQLLGWAPVGDLARPFKEDHPFKALLEGGGDNAAAPAAAPGGAAAAAAAGADGTMAGAGARPSPLRERRPLRVAD